MDVIDEIPLSEIRRYSPIWLRDGLKTVNRKGQDLIINDFNPKRRFFENSCPRFRRVTHDTLYILIILKKEKVISWKYHFEIFIIAKLDLQVWSFLKNDWLEVHSGY